MSKFLDIAQLGNPILRQQAQPVTDVTDQEIQAAIDDLIETVISVNGVGIAAPQVSRSQCLFIVASHPNPRYPHAPLMEPTAMINPKIIAHSTEMVKDWEGCLSVRGVRGLVPRYKAIALEYTDRDGCLQSQEFTDFVARIIQHELDHLNGIVFTDRIESDRDLYTEEQYRVLIGTRH